MKPKPTIMLMMLIGLLAAGGRCYACITTPTAAFKESVIDTMTGAKVTFDASASFDPGGYIVKFEFDFDYEVGDFVPGHTECLEGCGGARDHYFDGIVTHVFDTAAQDFEVAVRVTDNASPPNTDIATCTVNVHKGVNPDGTSDYTSIQAAVDGATSGDEIWVAPGWYQEDVTFDTVDGIILRSTNPGDAEVVGKTVIRAVSMSSKVVVFEDGITEATKLQGFTVEGPGGWGTPSSPGRGIYCNGGSPVIENCVIRGHYTGVYNDNSAYPVISGCVICDNDGESGSGMVNDGASALGKPVKVRNCILTGNRNEYKGGGIYNADTELELTNCTIYGNEAEVIYGTYGGGVHNHGNGSLVTMKNCIVWGNIASEASEIDNFGGVDPVVTVDYSDVNPAYCYGVTWRAGNINADPEFSAEGDPAGADGIFGTLDDGLRIRPGSGSPCIDKGDPDTTTVEAGDVDLWGNARFRDGDYGDGDVVIDMGACEAASVWFVDDREEGGDGKSWGDAFTDLQDALDASRSGDEIWVAAGAGDYKPSEMTSPPNNRSKTFQLLEGRMVYGGFPAGSGDPSWADRDWLDLENTTTLSGDIDSGGNEDSYHVVKGADDAVIDGFVISGGKADGSGVDNLGGGMYNENCELVVRNCVLSGNTAYRGGGMYNKNCSPVVRNCVLSENTANLGGGVFNDSASPKFERCVFVGNIANANGGGMFNDGATSNPEVVNCVFQGNSSVGGGGMLNVSRGSHPIITNCTLTGNEASGLPGGGGMLNGAASPTVTNCIFWGNTCDAYPARKEVYNFESAANPSFRACDIENCLDESENWVENLGTDSGENMDAPPVFVMTGDPGIDEDGLDNQWMTVDDGLRLEWESSPCVDAADGDAAPEKDISGFERVDVGATGGGVGQPDYVDIGAYEADPVVVVVMCWIDESRQTCSPHYCYTYYSQPEVYDAHLSAYRALVSSIPAVVVRSGCLVPAAMITDVLPEGYDPPEEISVETCGRPPTTNELLADFERIRDGFVPDYIILSVDNSGSMSTETIDPDPDKPYTTFKNVLKAAYTDAVFVERDGWYDFRNQAWVDEMRAQIQAIVEQ